MNDIVLKMAEAGVLVELDEAFQHHIRFIPEAAMRERRFRECQAFVRKLSPNTLGVLPLSLVTLDLISPSLLERVLLEKPFRHEGKVLLDWTTQVDKDDPQRVRWDRRELSDFSTLCFSVQQRKASEQISDALLLLQSCQEYSDTATETLLDELRKDQMAWVVKSLTGPLWAHVTELRPIWALARASLARAQCGLVPARSAVSSASNQDALAGFQTVARNITLEPTGESSRPELLDAALEKISTSSEEEDDFTLERWFSELLGLKMQLLYSDSNSAVLLCWMLDLVESGTIGKPDARAVTRARYMRNLVVRLWLALRRHNLLLTTATGPDLFLVYSEVLADPSVTDPVALRAALASFQSYAVEVWGLPFVPLGKAVAGQPEAYPRVQVVYEHEARRVLEWLCVKDASDPRLLEVSHTLFTLLWARPFRLEEAHQLRLKNVIFNSDGSVDVEVLERTDRQLKNTNSNRRLTVYDADAVATLRRWIDKRRAEGAVPDDYVLGCREGSDLYRPTAVQSLLRSLVQASTGDPRMVLHALRHSFASHEFPKAVVQANDHDYNVFTHLAYKMGHGSFDMTLRFYVHIFEAALRREIDDALAPLSDLTGAQAEEVTSVKSNTLIQAARRHKMGLHELVTKRVTEGAASVVMPAALDTRAWITPACPTLGGSATAELSIRVVFDLISHWSRRTDMDDAELAHLLEVEASIPARVRSSLLALANETELHKARVRGKAPTPVVVAQQALEVLQLRPEALLQKKYTELRIVMFGVSPDDSLRETARSVTTLLSRPGYIRLDRPKELFILLELLKRWKINSNRLLISAQPTSASDATAEKRALIIGESFATVLASAPFVQVADSYHPGRPAAYLLWPSSDGAREPHAVDVRGLICALWCLCICFRARAAELQEGF